MLAGKGFPFPILSIVSRFKNNLKVTKLTVNHITLFDDGEGFGIISS